ncbi:ATP-binding cassette domain-containing protein [Robbsia sp. Bb-Pol-6]|uniref:ATP-binding cassette domain-containing protein n=1 Tax=Robbsia betulipollinis TaxID=2981849 RepID=A0ABT3ZQN7_9BURK|nr:ATP-binding cassette domain-containing protein [Robbsia betulipollinis]MCY0388732.1 ATP-binding cassette domain-containing protein [Robbsia betulipollinis]
MRRRPATPLAWLGGLLAIYLCAPLLASLPRIAASDWGAVDWRTLGSAAGVSAASATLAALLIALGGIPLGYWLTRRSSRAASVIGFLVQLPLALPPLTSGILLLFLFGPYSAAGRLTNGALTDSFIGILLAGVFVAAPFLIVAARSAFASVDPLLEDVAATLGHRAHARFFRVALPLAWPAIRAGLLLSWLRAFGEFGATVMVAYHPYSLPVYTYVAFGSQGLPVMMPIVLPTLAVALVAALLAAWSARLSPWRATREPMGGGKSDGPARHAVAAARAERGLLPATSPGGPALPLFPLCPAPALLRDPPSPPPRHALVQFAFGKQLGGFRLDIAWAPQARRLAILGASGSGKSMLLRLLAGLDAADTARFALDGESYAQRDAETRHIAYVPQDYGLFPHLTVWEQWVFARDAQREDARSWGDHLGLAGLEHRLPAALSLGQRQRVAIVRALARPARLILLDEPFSALDTPRRRQLRESLRELQKQISATTILVTHDPDEAALLADELLVIDRGQVLQAGPTEAVFARPASLTVAQLLGLSAIGVGVADAAGWLDIGAGIRLDVGAQARRQLAQGSRWMWRVDAERVHPAGADGLAATVEGTVLQDGRPYLALRLGGARVLLRDRCAQGTEGEAPARKTGAPYPVTIDPEGIDVWPEQCFGGETDPDASMR